MDQERAIKRQMKIEDEIVAKKLKLENEERNGKVNGTSGENEDIRTESLAS